MIRWLPILAALSLSAFALASPPRVQLIRPPRILIEGQTVQLHVRIPPHADNRLLRLDLADELGTVTGTERRLEGDRAAANRWISWLMPRCEGNCVLIAALYGVNGFVARDTSPVTVHSVGP
jgi:hypothetical protein